MLTFLCGFLAFVWNIFEPFWGTSRNICLGFELLGTCLGNLGNMLEHVGDNSESLGTYLDFMGCLMFFQNTF